MLYSMNVEFERLLIYQELVPMNSARDSFSLLVSDRLGFGKLNFSALSTDYFLIFLDLTLQSESPEQVQRYLRLGNFHKNYSA